MADSNTKEKKTKHRKQSSIHRRRGLELNNPSAFADDFSLNVADAALAGTDRKASEVTDLFNPTDKQHVMLYPGDMVEVAYAGDAGERIDVAMIHWISENKELIGVEFEGPIGKTDGANDEGQRFMRTPGRCAAFVPSSAIRRIIPMGTPPRFKASHDIYPGDVVMVDKTVGVGIARYVSAQIVGIELNAAVGTSDGIWEGRRYFTVGSKKAYFSEPSMLKKIHPEDLLNKLNFSVERLNVLEENSRTAAAALSSIKDTAGLSEDVKHKLEVLEQMFS